MNKIMRSILCVLLLFAMLATTAFAEDVDTAPVETVEDATTVEDETCIKLPDANWGVAYSFSLMLDADDDVNLHIEGDLPAGIEFDVKKSALKGTPEKSDAGKTFEFALQTVDEDGNVLSSDNYSIYVATKPIKSITLTGTEPTAGKAYDAIQKERVRCVTDAGILEVKKEKIEVTWFELKDGDETDVFETFEEGKDYVEVIKLPIPEGYAPESHMPVKLNNNDVRPFIDDEEQTIELRRYFMNFGEKTSVRIISFDMNLPKEGENDIPRSRIKTVTPKLTVIYGNYALDPVDPVVDGYIFCGWFTESSCEELFDFDDVRIVDNVELYAKWIRELSKTDIELSAVFAGSSQKLPAAKMSDDYSTEILGWYEKADSEDMFSEKLELGKTYYLKGTITAKEDRAVFAEEERVEIYVDGMKAEVTLEEDGSYTFMAPVTIKAAQHEHIMEFVAATEATCEENGYFAHYLCKSCGNRYLDEAGEVLLTEDNGVIPATGHKWGPWTVREDPACEEDGEEARVCQNDSAHMETRTIPAVGHDWGDWEETVAPTCESAGSETRVCKNDPTHTESSSIPALGHNFGDWTVTRPSTCKEAGEETRYCQNNNEHKETRELPLVDHTWGEWQTTKNPTEKENGEMVRTCSVCGDKETQIIPTLKHVHNMVHHDAVASTCTQFGNIAYYQCDSCKRMFSDAEGKNELQTVTTAKKDHNWGEWKVIQNASTDFTGLRTRTCTLCGEQQAETIPKIEVQAYMNYKIDNADQLRWQQGGTEALPVTSNAPAAKLTGVYVDGKVVSVANYTYRRSVDADETTSVGMKAEYLNNLDAGEHMMELRFSNGTATAKLVIESAPVPSVAPTEVPQVTPTATQQPTTTRTKENRQNSAVKTLLAVALLALVALGVTALILYKKGVLGEFLRRNEEDYEYPEENNPSESKPRHMADDGYSEYDNRYTEDRK